MPDENCDPACNKIIIDFFLSVFGALFYARSIEKREDLDPKHRAAALMYNETATEFGKIALRLNREGLKKPDVARLIEQTLNECYRSDDFIEWGRTPPADNTAAEAHTEEIFAWIKQSQEWYTAFTQSMGH